MGELLHDVYRVQHSDVTDHLRKMYDNEMGRIRQIDRSQKAKKMGRRKPRPMKCEG